MKEKLVVDFPPFFSYFLQKSAKLEGREGGKKFRSLAVYSISSILNTSFKLSKKVNDSVIFSIDR